VSSDALLTHAGPASAFPTAGIRRIIIPSTANKAGVSSVQPHETAPSRNIALVASGRTQRRSKSNCDRPGRRAKHLQPLYLGSGELATAQELKRTSKRDERCDRPLRARRGPDAAVQVSCSVGGLRASIRSPVECPGRFFLATKRDTAK